MPIPEPHPPSPKKYKDLNFNGISGLDALKECSTKSISSNSYCHYDPALNENVGIFGQAATAQKELVNGKVGIGDLFLFFGFFKQFFSRGRELHHLFGWLQVDKIIEGDKGIRKYLTRNNLEHPHGFGETNTYKNNTIYIGKKNLTIARKKLSSRGYGLFKKTHEDLILTRKGASKGSWKLPKKYFYNSKKLFVKRLKWLDEEECLVNNYQRGQEFILDAKKNPKIVNWAKYLIEKHG